MYGNITNIFYIENGVYKNIHNIIQTQFIYKRNTFNKKWISKVIDNKFLLVLNLDNEIVFDKGNETLPDANVNVDEEQTNNQIVVLTNITAIDNKMYSNMIYINDNPTLKNYSQVNNIVFNYICNNSINLNHYKNLLDPKFNEYINRLQSSIADYINDKC